MLQNDNQRWSNENVIKKVSADVQPFESKLENHKIKLQGYDFEVFDVCLIFLNCSWSRKFQSYSISFEKGSHALDGDDDGEGDGDCDRVMTLSR